MLRDFANHGLHSLDDLGEILMVADTPCSAGSSRCIGCASGLAILVIDINQINVTRHIEFARAQLTHANNPQRGFLLA